MSVSHHTDHTPDRSKLPAPLQRLEWQESDPFKDQFFDGDRLLVAVPVCPNGDRNWSYSIETVHISCDEHYFSIEDMNGEPWGWDLDCIDYWIKF